MHALGCLAVVAGMCGLAAGTAGCDGGAISAAAAVEAEPKTKPAREIEIISRFDGSPRTKYHLRVLPPAPGVDYKIVTIRPDPSKEYKMRIIRPDRGMVVTSRSRQAAQALGNALSRHRAFEKHYNQRLNEMLKDLKRRESNHLQP